MDDNYGFNSSHSSSFNDSPCWNWDEQNWVDQLDYDRKRKRDEEYFSYFPGDNTRGIRNRGNRRFSWIPSYVVLVLIFYTTLVKFVLVGLAIMH